MNITKLITSLQQAATAATTPAEYAILSKAIEKLNVGKVTTVASAANLPTNLTTNGNLYFITASGDLCYNVGATWNLFYIAPEGAIAYAWGSATSGMLGDGTTVGKSSPVTVVGGITTWSQIAAGDRWGLGLTSAGIAYAWGYGRFGRLGTNSTTDISSPATVAGITTWTQIAAGTTHGLGVTSAGIAYGWGYNGRGQVGNGTTSDRSSPVTVVGGITNWSQLSGGATHSLGLTSAGIAYAWGYAAFGRLGDGTTVGKSSPVTVVGGITTWSQLVAGGYHSLGRTSAGIAYAWGRADFGQLGSGGTTSVSSPVTVIGGITTWSQLSSRSFGSLALTSAGIAYEWGSNQYGQLGDNTTVSKSSPVTVVGGITNWSQLTGGHDNRSFGVTSSGIAYAWGGGVNGGLGTNNTSNRSSPVTLSGGITTWTKIGGGPVNSGSVSAFGLVTRPASSVI
jgi:alpha-tubulin suppressor-like RCC1 family protein